MINFNRRYRFVFAMLAVTMLVGVMGLGNHTSCGSDIAHQRAQDATKITLTYQPREGRSHPDFILPSIDGKESIQLAKYRGKKVLLLHFASW
jgi:hypothetical protein